MVGSTLGFVTLALALGLFALIGFRARRHGGDLEDYMVARNSQGAGTLGLSFLASGLGAWILFAPPEVGAFIGLAGIIGYAVAAAAPLLVFALLGPRLRRVVPAGHSLTEFVRLRFGGVFHAYVVGVSVLYMLMFVTAELTAIGAVTATLSGLDARIAVVAVAVATLAYTAYGGLRASLRTDRWQAVLVIVLLAIGGAAAVLALPAPAEALADSGRLTVDRVGIEAGVTLVIAVTAANLFHQGYWQRVWAARGTRSLTLGGSLGGLGSIPVVLAVGLLGILALGAGVDLGDPPVPFFALVPGLPDWVIVVVLVAGVALVASSVDTLENGLAALVAAERPSLSLRAARVVTVVLMVPAVAVAFQGYSVLRLLLIADLLAATAVVPALLGLWRRATPAGALTGGAAGLIGAVLPGIVATGSLTAGLLLATFP
ncbi:MAG: sodium:solute symporter, partial [Nitriliruptorales bacterium]|nr:sodium:solute symporter [Nitriliruptorales bacterium]